MPTCRFPFSLVFVCLLTAISVSAQTVLVDEGRVTGNLKDGHFLVDLPLKFSPRTAPIRVRLEVLDEYDNPVATADFDREPNVGFRQLAIPVKAGVSEKLLWYRLKYSVYQPNTEEVVSGTMAMSEIMQGLFELQVTAPNSVFSGMNVRAHAVALHPYSKKPVGNVEVAGTLHLELDTDADEDELKIVARGKTNSEGVTTLDFQIPPGLSLDYGTKLTMEGKKNGVVRKANSDLTVSENSFVYLYTDKPLYQPGQKLYIRGLYLDTAKRPLAGKDLEIEMEDEEGETVLERTVTTSRFGVISIEWQIPADFKLGTYRIGIDNDDSDGVGTTEIKVSRYDLPNFVVNAKPQKSFYLLSDTYAEVSVNANYLFGRPVQGGTVRIVEEHERTWNFSEQQYDTQEGEAYNGTAGSDGTAMVKLSLTAAVERLKKDQWKRFADVKFAAYFTDPTTNRTEQKRFDIRVSREPIHIYFVRPAADPNPAIPFQFYVSAFYADGSPAKVDLNVSGFYDNAYTSETLAKGRTNSYGAAKFELTFPQKPFSEAKNEFNLNITARDKDGNAGTLNENVYVDPGSRQIRIKSDKTIYAPGEPIIAKILSTDSDPVFLEITKNSSTIWSKQVNVKNGDASATIPYRPDFKGELTITAYRFDNDDEDRYSMGSKTVIYPSPTELLLNLSGTKGTYRPGEDARLAFDVRTGEGKGVETALGIVMIDKAIEERAQTEQLRDNLTDVRKLLGTADAFGDLRRKDLDKIDTSRPISNDLQLAGEYLLANKFTSPQSFSSDSYANDFGTIYREPMRKRLQPLTEALQKRNEQGFEFPSEGAQLARIARQAGLSLDQFKDAWGEPFQTSFKRDRGDVVIEFRSSSADKKPGSEDDFLISEIRFQWFAQTLDRINKAIKVGDPDGAKPRSAEDLIRTLNAAGVTLSSIPDNWGRPVTVATRVYTRGSVKTFLETVGNLDGARQEVPRSKVVEQEIALHNFISLGADGVGGNSDDFTLGTMVVVLSERDLFVEPSGKITLSKGQTSNNRGAIAGTITDANGAVVPGSIIVATNIVSQEKFEVTTNDEGFYLIANLPSGRYSVRAESMGFMAAVIEHVIVSAYNAIKVDIGLQVGTVNSVVEVTGGVALTMDTTSSSVATSVTRSESKSLVGLLGRNGRTETFTPRVREYFPETLVWQPELITDKYGRAAFNFKMADSLTTWKLYVLGSTESGEFGLAEKELQTFQPFFAELDTPKVLTEGDEISLPVPIRNYTNRRQRVKVSLEQNLWSTMPKGNSRQIDVEPNSSQNAIMDFVAVSPTTDGKQRVSALAGMEGDSVEKTVTVKPDGREEVRTQSGTFQGSASFSVDFPESAFPQNRSAMLRIYPNLLAHVGESVEGLLQRPHGCGEQTTSSTYPNLMIHKLEKDLGKKVNPQLKEKATKYLLDGYKRLLNYQTPGGGFSYWGKNDTPNAPLTAYVIRFLSDADEFIDVDASVLQNAKRWLESQQSAAGGWGNPDGPGSGATAYILRSLLHKTDLDQSARVSKAFDLLERSIDDRSDSYVLANTALIAMKLGNRTAAERSLRRLAGKAQTSKDGTFWTAASTPFYGWGRAAEIETTAFAVGAFAEFKRTQAADQKNDLDAGNLILGGLKFILANKDSHGVWYSTQTTVNVLNTLISLQQSTGLTDTARQNISIVVNGSPVRNVAVPSASLEPIIVDLGQSLKEVSNRVEIKGANQAPMGAHLVVRNYNDWATSPSTNRYFDLDVAFDKTAARIGEVITCNVEMRRKTYTGHGMVLTEIGLPPGADVDRSTLDSARSKGVFSRYDILPDKVVVYSWNGAAPMSFSFKFKHRYGLNAQAAPSIAYDYYNPEATTVVPPRRFRVE